MNKNIPFQQEFIYWLVTENDRTSILTYESASSYCNYLGALNNCLLINNASFFDSLSKFNETISFSHIVSLCSVVYDYLFLEDIHIITGYSLAYISKWRSALISYQQFLSNHLAVDFDSTVSDFFDIIILPRGRNYPKITSVSTKPRNRIKRYPKKDLVKNFTFRLISQNRLSGALFFPIGFIERFLKKNNQHLFVNNWLNSHLNKIEIFTENNSFTFEDITELQIQRSNDKSLLFGVFNDGNTLLLYSNKASGTTRIPIECTKLNEIAIDHVLPMKSILIDNQHALNQLSYITSVFRQVVGDKSLVREYRSAFTSILESSFIHQIDIHSLISELALIESKTKLQIMLKTENAIKSSN